MATTSEGLSGEDGILDDAYRRLHATGPEFEGWLSNHGPMVAEAMVRHGHAGEVHRWLDGYISRLEEFPGRSSPIGVDWQAALGDPSRVADWTIFFEQAMTEEPWGAVLGSWWPRLLPGVAAAATHGVIRVGHAVRSLLLDGEDRPRLDELAHGLAYWAARFQAVPGGPAPTGEPARAGEPAPAGEELAGATDLASALDLLPRIPEQAGGIRERLDRLAELPRWDAALASARAPTSPEEVPTWLDALVDAAVARYLRYGHGNGVMLVHSATAPNAIARTLPALPRHLWTGSAQAAWAAFAALTAGYAPTRPEDLDRLPRVGDRGGGAQEIFALAVEHGDEHVIKFADTALDSLGRARGGGDAPAAVMRATTIIPVR
ncbi:MAG TPA: hypothetical protein VMD59_12465 [Acidimicrobiales bacterium]|nr:hypothetical protein [Acidimicrobiales bacterium]